MRSGLARILAVMVVCGSLGGAALLRLGGCRIPGLGPPEASLRAREGRIRADIARLHLTESCLHPQPSTFAAAVAVEDARAEGTDAVRALPALPAAPDVCGRLGTDVRGHLVWGDIHRRGERYAAAASRLRDAVARVRQGPKSDPSADDELGAALAAFFDAADSLGDAQERRLHASTVDIAAHLADLGGHDADVANVHVIAAGWAVARLITDSAAARLMGPTSEAPLAGLSRAALAIDAALDGLPTEAPADLRDAAEQLSLALRAVVEAAPGIARATAIDGLREAHGAFREVGNRRMPAI